MSYHDILTVCQEILDMNGVFLKSYNRESSAIRGVSLPVIPIPLYRL